MTREEIISISTSAGIDVSIAESNIKILERFADLVAAHEREECAKLCEELGKNYWEFSISRNAAETCAKYIRKRGEQ